MNAACSSPAGTPTTPTPDLATCAMASTIGSTAWSVMRGLKDKSAANAIHFGRGFTAFGLLRLPSPLGGVPQGTGSGVRGMWRWSFFATLTTTPGAWDSAKQG